MELRKKTYLYIQLKMVFTKDNLAAVVTCFTEKGWTGTLNRLDDSIWDILQELVYKGRCEPFANLNQRSSECYQRQMA